MTHHKTTIPQAKYHPETETALPRLQLSSKAEAVIGNIQKYVKACVFALSIGLAGGAYADDTTKGADIALASTSQAASADAEGAGIDFQKQLAAIENEILATNQKIQNLEGLSILSRDEKKELFLLKRSLVALENQRQEYQTAVIKEENIKQELNSEAIGTLEEINSAIKG